MLSIDAGRPATMSYSFQQHQLSGNMLANGFGASRGKPDAVNKIPIPTLPTISASLYDDPNALFPPTPTARTSGRAQLLAGLRTAPKTPTGSEHPGLGPFDGEFQNETQSGVGHLNFLMNRNERAFGHDLPRHQPAHSAHLHAARSSLTQDHFNNIQFSTFGGLPTPPTSSHYLYQGDQDYEAKAYADLLARNMSLAQQQQQQQHLIQQLRIAQQTQQLQQIHQQMQPLQIQSTISQAFGTPPISPAVYSPTVSSHPQIHSMYNPNAQANTQSYIPQQVRPKQPGFSAQAQPEQNSLSAMTSQLRISPSPPLARPVARAPSSRSTPSPTKEFNAPDRVAAKKTPSPPPASISTFRRGHKKCISLSGCNSSMNPALADGGPKTSIPRLSGVPSTPLNSTFGGRGDHPIRQPRGPPALEEVIAKPTAKHEGSKNFSSRQRRRALTKLVNAGLERRGTKQTAPSAPMTMTPVSEHDTLGYSKEVDPMDHTMRKDTSLEASSTYRTEGRRTPRRTGLAAPHLAAHSAEKRRSAVF
ncbi:hypothetical protein TWF281_004930 [Arthrobotrys megalospora]